MADDRTGQNNRLTLLESGRAYFPALLAEIDAARQEIFLESYLFVDDAIGRRVAASLAAAAQRGVLVWVLVDGFGARQFPDQFGSALAAAGVRWRLYRREIARLSLHRRRLRRMHRKLVVIDARVAFVGGINIVDDATPLGAALPTFDYAVQVEGPLVADIHQAVARLWRFFPALRPLSRSRPQAIPSPPVVASPAASAAIAVRSARLLLRDNWRHRQDIEWAYVRAIRRASRTVVIANAYFLPGFRFRRALRRAVRRGVAVTVLLQGRSDHPLFRYATQALYGDLLADGIRVFEYRQGFLHAKVAVIDGLWATVGSSNIDPFSLLLAREANLVVEDAGFGRTLAASLDAAMRDSAVEWTSARLVQQPFYLRWLRRFCYRLVSFLIGLAGHDR